ncbi:unnamed protein product [Enterobius vermicularis]|uniref:ANF_receptor domain-containing protein n=1 Tax=Enterobius vermicularis TaxID=51028 RepID=A0A0N4VBZ4_ENTVE|nr:unnamed protein product [Enterobius vermicularis]
MNIGVFECLVCARYYYSLATKGYAIGVLGTDLSGANAINSYSSCGLDSADFKYTGSSRGVEIRIVPSLGLKDNSGDIALVTSKCHDLTNKQLEKLK